jgi:hypothetical protein
MEGDPPNAADDDNRRYQPGEHLGAGHNQVVAVPATPGHMKWAEAMP